MSPPPSSGTNAKISLCAAVSPTQQAALEVASGYSLSPSDCVSYMTDELFIAGMDSSSPYTGLSRYGTLNAMMPMAFRIDWLVPTTEYYHYLAIAGGDWKLGTFGTRTDDHEIVVGGLGFRPAGVFLFSHGAAKSSGFSEQDHWQAITGAFTSLDERVTQVTWEQDNSSPTSCARAARTDAVYARLGPGGTLQGLMDVAGLGQGFFSLVMDRPDPDPAFVAYLAFGSREGQTREERIFLPLIGRH